jgi:hypothetical protein
MYILSNNYIMNKIIENEDNKSQDSNSENVNENNKRCKKRSTKKEMYEEEREEFIKELNKILGINENNNYVYKYEIETNNEFEKYIKDNMDKIRKMWKTGLWGYFSNKKEKGSGNILGLYRSLLNNSGYMMFSKQKTKTLNDEKDVKTLYYIEKNIKINYKNKKV